LYFQKDNTKSCVVLYQIKIIMILWKQWRYYYYKVHLIILDKTGYKDRWNNADQKLQCKNKHTQTLEIVGNDGISLYNGNSFRHPWQQEQKQQQQSNVILQVNNKEVLLLKICVYEHYTWHWEGKNFSELFLVKDNRKHFIFVPLQFYLKYTFRKVQTNQMGLQFYGTHQHLCYAEDVIILGGSTYGTNKIWKL
jgi:hypothetical protein